MLVVELDITDPDIAREVLEVQRAAYEIEAQLIGSREIPPLHENLDEMIDAPLQWLGIRRNGRVAAALAFTRDGTSIDIDRLIVDPSWMRLGLATALLESLDAASTITVSTGADNVPAHRLYSGLGFAVTGTSTPVPGLRVTHYVRAGE